jgi:hypothetical protein
MNVNIRITINSGAAFILYSIGVFALVYGTSISPAVERIFPVALSGWTGGVAGFWMKRNANNKLALEEKIKGDMT